MREMTYDNSYYGDRRCAAFRYLDDPESVIRFWVTLCHGDEKQARFDEILAGLNAQEGSDGQRGTVAGVR